MTRHLVSDDVTKARVAKWLMEATPVDENTTWVERRLAIEFGGHLFFITKEQVFQCAHCGWYDHEWKNVGVLNFFEETFGIKPIEVEITCTVSRVQE